MAAQPPAQRHAAVPSRTEPWGDVIKGILSRGWQSALCNFIMAPFTTAKAIQLAQYTAAWNCSTNPSWNMIETAIELPQRHGLDAFWRGQLFSIAVYVPVQLLQVIVKRTVTHLLVDQSAQSDVRLTRIMASGFITLGVVLVIVYPIDLIKYKLVTDVGVPRRYEGVVHCVTSIVSTDGIQGLYEGFLPSVLGMIVYRGLYFLAHSYAKPYLGAEGSWRQAISTQALGTLCGLVSYPFMLLQRELMLQAGIGMKGTASRDGDFVRSAISTVQNSGVSGLWHGALTASLLNIVDNWLSGRVWWACGALADFVGHVIHRKK